MKLKHKQPCGAVYIAKEAVSRAPSSDRERLTFANGLQKAGACKVQLKYVLRLALQCPKIGL